MRQSIFIIVILVFPLVAAQDSSYSDPAQCQFKRSCKDCLAWGNHTCGWCHYAVGYPVSACYAAEDAAFCPHYWNNDTCCSPLNTCESCMRHDPVCKFSAADNTCFGDQPWLVESGKVLSTSCTCDGILDCIECQNTPGCGYCAGVNGSEGVCRNLTAPCAAWHNASQCNCTDMMTCNSCMRNYWRCSYYAPIGERVASCHDGENFGINGYEMCELIPFCSDYTPWYVCIGASQCRWCYHDNITTGACVDPLRACPAGWESTKVQPANCELQNACNSCLDEHHADSCVWCHNTRSCQHKSTTNLCDGQVTKYGNRDPALCNAVPSGACPITVSTCAECAAVPGCSFCPPSSCQIVGKETCPYSTRDCADWCEKLPPPFLGACLPSPECGFCAGAYDWETRGCFNLDSGKCSAVSFKIGRETFQTCRLGCDCRCKTFCTKCTLTDRCEFNTDAGLVTPAYPCLGNVTGCHDDLDAYAHACTPCLQQSSSNKYCLSDDRCYTHATNVYNCTAWASSDRCEDTTPISFSTTVLRYMLKDNMQSFLLSLDRDMYGFSVNPGDPMIGLTGRPYVTNPSASSRQTSSNTPPNSPIMNITGDPTGGLDQPGYLITAQCTNVRGCTLSLTLTEIAFPDDTTSALFIVSALAGGAIVLIGVLAICCIVFRANRRRGEQAGQRNDELQIGSASSSGADFIVATIGSEHLRKQTTQFELTLPPGSPARMLTIVGPTVLETLSAATPPIEPTTTTAVHETLHVTSRKVHIAACEQIWIGQQLVDNIKIADVINNDIAGSQ